MAIDAGDVVITFLGNTTQLDQSFSSVQNKVETTNTQAAVSTVELKAAQAELRAALQAVTAEGGQTVENLNRLTEAEARLVVATRESKIQHDALKQSLNETAVSSELLAGVQEELSGAIGGVLGAFAAVEGIKSFIENVQKSVLNLELLSEKTGINITTLAGIEHVSEAAGISFDQVAGALTRLERAQVLAVEGHQQQIAAFQRLGITVQELKTLSPEDLFFRVADAMQQAKTHGEAAASAWTLLGRGGAALIPIFNEGGEALRGMVEEAGKASGVTSEAGKAARDWEQQTANLSEAFRAGLIPIMEALIPIIKAVETAGSALWLSLKEIGIGIGAIFLAIYDGAFGVTKVIEDLVIGNFVKAAADAKQMGDEFTKNFQTTMGLWKGQAQQSAEFIQNVWKQTKPYAPVQDDLTDLGAHAKVTTENLIAEAKATSDGVIAQINRRKDANTLAYHQGLIDADTWARADVKATDDARMAHEKFLSDVVRIYRQAGDAAKAQTAQRELDNQKIKDESALIKDVDKATTDLHKETVSFQATTEKTWGQMNKEIEKTSDSVKEMEQRSPLTGLIRNVVLLNNDLKKLGIEGWGTAAAKLDQAQQAEKRLNDLGIKDGKIWLEVQKAKLTAMIAVARIEHTSTAQMEKDLAAVTRQLKSFTGELPSMAEEFVAFQQVVQDSVSQFALDIGTAMASVIAGQKTAAQAIEASVGALIKSLCDHWAKYFAAKAIADMFGNPALGAAELAAAAALEVAGSLAGSLGGGTAGSGGGGFGDTTITQGRNTQTTPNPTGGQNIPHLAAGALITGPTVAMLGDNRSRHEAVIPLDDPRALKAIGEAMSGSAGGSVTVHLVTDIPQFVRQVSRQVNKGRARLKSSDSIRVTRRSV